ncbi:hypothetical protein ACLBXM_19290 [Xanthobacteraceae bacterium A53D]
MRKIMKRSLTTSRARALLLGATAIATLPVVSLPAAAQTDPNLMQNALTTLGIIEDQKPDIQYRERAPLVVPPAQATSGALPPPQSTMSSTLPNWPKDPDILRAEQAKKKEANQPAMRYEDRRDVLMPSELNKGRRANAGRLDGPAQRYEDKRDVELPSQLGFRSWFGVTPSDQKPMVFTGEPERESLTQPPVGYQTPAPNAPYGVVEKKDEPFKFPTLFDRQ